MKHKITQNQMIESYLYEVARRLPKDQKEDIIKELSTHIEDQLEFEEASDSLESTAKVLEALGSPSSVANAHNSGSPRLIGNELADAYFTALYIIIAISLSATVLGFFLDSGFSVDISAASAITKLIAGGIESVITSVGTMSIIFYLIQKSINKKSVEKATLDATERWSASSLKPIEKDLKQVSLSDIVTDLVTTGVALIFLNKYTDLVISPLVIQGGERFNLSLFNPDLFNNFMPFMNITLIVSFVFAIVKLVARNWSEWLRWGEVITSALSLAVMGAMALTPNLLINSSFLGSSESAKALALKLEEGILISVKITFAVIAVLLVVDILVHLRAIMRNRV